MRGSGGRTFSTSIRDEKFIHLRKTKRATFARHSIILKLVLNTCYGSSCDLRQNPMVTFCERGNEPSVSVFLDSPPVSCSCSAIPALSLCHQPVAARCSKMLPCCHLHIMPVTVATFKVCSNAVDSSPNEYTDACYIKVFHVRLEILLKICLPWHCAASLCKYFSTFQGQVVLDLGLLHPEDDGNTIVRKVGNYLPIDTA